MIIYRPHRGNLYDAMAEAREFNNEQEMKEYIIEDWHSFAGEEQTFSIEDIVIADEEVNDERIGWQDSRDVCVKRMGNKIYDVPQCIGTCATQYVLQDVVRKVR